MRLTGISVRDARPEEVDAVLELWQLAYDSASRRSAQQDIPALLSHGPSARLLLAELRDASPQPGCGVRRLARQHVPPRGASRLPATRHCPASGQRRARVVARVRYGAWAAAASRPSSRATTATRRPFGSRLVTSTTLVCAATRKTSFNSTLARPLLLSLHGRCRTRRHPHR